MNKKLLALSATILLTLTLMVPAFGLLPPPPPPPGAEPEIAVKIEGDWMHTLPPAVPSTPDALAFGPLDPASAPPYFEDGWDYCYPIPSLVDDPDKVFEPYELDAPAFCTTIDVEIWLLNVTDLYAYEFRLLWNYGFLGLESYSLTDLDDGMGEQHVVDADAVTPGMQPAFVQVWTHLGEVDGFSGSAKVADLVFHVNQDPLYPDTFYSLIYILAAEASGPTTDNLPLSRQHGMIVLNSVEPGVTLTPEDMIIISAQEKQFTVSVGVEDVVKMKSFVLELEWCRTGLTICDGVWDENWKYYQEFADEHVSIFKTNDDVFLYMGYIIDNPASDVYTYLPGYEVRAICATGEVWLEPTHVLIEGCVWNNATHTFVEWRVPLADVDLAICDQFDWDCDMYECGVTFLYAYGPFHNHIHEQIELDLQKHPIVVTDFLPGPYTFYAITVDPSGKKVTIVVERDCEKPSVNGTGTIAEVTLTSLSPWGYKTVSIPDLCYEETRKKVPPYRWYDGPICMPDVIHMWLPDECHCFITATLTIDGLVCTQNNEEVHWDWDTMSNTPYLGDYTGLGLGSTWNVGTYVWPFAPMSILYDFRPISGDFDMSGHVGLEDLMAIAAWYGADATDAHWPLISDFDIVTSPGSAGEIDIFDLTVVAKQFCKNEPWLWPGEEDYFIDP